jgi:hypothetical protein
MILRKSDREGGRRGGGERERVIERQIDREAKTLKMMIRDPHT